MIRVVSVAALIAGAILTVGCGDTSDGVTPGVDGAVAPRRIVSLAPSLTETLYALGLGARVVGVTRYCAYPPEVAELPKVGGHLDPNFEAIVSLDPDLVVVIPSSSENGQRLESLGIRVLEVDQHDVQAVLE
jgi:iron complex transport system substrate-binding protein